MGRHGLRLRSGAADEFVDAFCGLLEAQTGAFRSRTIARYALVENRHGLERWVTAILVGLGAADPLGPSRTLMACADGLILHRTTVDDTLDLRPSVEIVVRACLDSGA